jgi:hypothetical protein
VVILRTPRRAAARIALHAGAVAHQREIPALRAHLAFVTLGLGLGAAFGLGWRKRAGGAGLAPFQGFQLLGRRQVVAYFLLQRDGAFDGVGDAAASAVGERGDACAGLTAVALRHRAAAHHHEVVRARAGEALGQVLRRALRLRLLAFPDALAERVEAGLVGIDMGQIKAAHVAHRELAEDVVEDRRRIFDAVVALHRQNC